MISIICIRKNLGRIDLGVGQKKYTVQALLATTLVNDELACRNILSLVMDGAWRKREERGKKREEGKER